MSVVLVYILVLPSGEGAVCICSKRATWCDSVVKKQERRGGNVDFASKEACTLFAHIHRHREFVSRDRLDGRAGSGVVVGVVVGVVLVLVLLCSSLDSGVCWTSQWLCWCGVGVGVGVGDVFVLALFVSVIVGVWLGVT